MPAGCNESRMFPRSADLFHVPVACVERRVSTRKGILLDLALLSELKMIQAAHAQPKMMAFDLPL